MSANDTTPIPPVMKEQTAKLVVRADDLLRKTQELLTTIGSAYTGPKSDLTLAEAQSIAQMAHDLHKGLQQLAGAVDRAKGVLDAKTRSLRFSEDQKTALGRLSKGEQVLWMQSGAAFDSLHKRGLVRVGHDDRNRVIAVLTEAGHEVVKDWKD